MEPATEKDIPQQIPRGPARSVEPKPAWEDRSPTAGLRDASDPFLTPRVVDRLAFEEYGRLLRQAIDRAASESEILARRAEAAAVVLEHLESFIGNNADAIERAAEILTSIDERSQTTRDLLAEIDRRAALLTRLAATTEQAAESRSEQFENRLRAIVDTAMDRFEETEDQLSARAASMRRSLLERVEELRGKGEAAVARIEQRAADATRAADEDLARAESRLGAINAAVESSSSKLSKATAELSAQAAASTETIESAAARAITAITGQTDRSGEAARRADDLTATLEQLLAHTEAESARLSRSLVEESARLDQAATDRLAGFVARLDAERADALDLASQALASEIAEHAAAGEALAGRLEAARRDAERVTGSVSLKSILARCEKAEDVAATALMQFEQLRDQTGVAAKTLGASLLSAAERIDELDARAARVTDAAAATLKQLLEPVGAATERAEGVIAQLKPWVELLQPVEPGRAPAPIAKLIDEIRRSVEATMKPVSTPERTPAAPDPELRLELEAMSEALLALTGRVTRLEGLQPEGTATAATKPRSSPRKKAAAKKPAARKPAPSSSAEVQAKPVARTRDASKAAAAAAQPKDPPKSETA